MQKNSFTFRDINFALKYDQLSFVCYRFIQSFCDADRGVTSGGQGGHNSPNAESLWGRRITAEGAEWLGGPRKVHTMSQVLSSILFFSTFASKRPQVWTWGAKLVSCPGRHPTLFCPWMQTLCTGFVLLNHSAIEAENIPETLTFWWIGIGYSNNAVTDYSRRAAVEHQVCRKTFSICKAFCNIYSWQFSINGRNEYMDICFTRSHSIVCLDPKRIRRWVSFANVVVHYLGQN